MGNAPLGIMLVASLVDSRRPPGPLANLEDVHHGAESTAYNAPQRVKQEASPEFESTKHHGPKDSHRPDLNPQAAAFLPAKSGSMHEERKHIPAKNVVAPTARPQSGRKVGGGGAVHNGTPAPSKPQGRDSDLSRALHGGRSMRTQGDRQPSSHDTAGHRTPDAAVLGRSPSRSGFTSANYLLNFQYDSRQNPSRGRGFSGRSRGGRKGAPRPQPYNRNKFLQANFRFLVSDAADLRRHEGDADLMLDWDDIVQVDMLTTQPVQCPISLETAPVCPQITPCGHVFAFPSIMAHLISHGGDNLRKASPCPLCFQPIVARELRLVHIHRVQEPKVGDQVTFRLLQRPRHSIIPSEVGSIPASVDDREACPPKVASAPCSWKSSAGDALFTRGEEGEPKEQHKNLAGGEATAALYNRFAKFTAVSDAAPLWKQAARQLAVYAAQVTAEGGQDAAMEAPFIYAAIDALAARAMAWAERRQRMLLDAHPDDASLLSPAEAASAASIAIKEVTSAALHSAQQQQEQKAVEEAQAREAFAQKAALLKDFPSLQPAAQPPQRAWGLSAAHVQAARAQAAEPAFSDDEFEGIDMEGVGSRSRPPSPSDVSPQEDDIFEADDEHGKGAGEKGLPIPGSLSSAKPVADAVGSANAYGGILGSSPVEHPSFLTSENYYFYQAVDGQWLFLAALDVRILLAHHGGSYAALPPTVCARLLELDRITQTEVIRKKMKFLGHLPLTGAFQVAEIDLGQMLPPEALAPFAEELRARATRRERKVQEEAKQAAREAARAAASAASSAAPTAAELKAMPLPHASLAAPTGGMSEDEALNTAVAASLAVESTPEGAPAELAATDVPQGGVSFAKITKLGYAATGPVLASTSPGTSTTMMGASPPGARSAWGRAAAPASTPPPTSSQSRPSGSPWGAATTPLNAASLSQHPLAAATPEPGGHEAGVHQPAPAAPAKGAEALPGPGKKTKKGHKQQTLLFSTTQRRY